MEYQDTSGEAYADFAPFSGTLDARILKALLKFGPLICQDIEKRLARSHQAVSGNLRHLVERGLVEDSGGYGRTTSGRRAIKWRVKP